MSSRFIDRLRHFQMESQGVFAIELVGVGCVNAMLDGASAHDRAFTACYCSFVDKVERGSGTGCLCCNCAPFSIESFPPLFLFAWPARETARAGMLVGICGSCALRPSEAIFADARRSLSLVWPNLQSFEEVAPAGRA